MDSGRLMFNSAVPCSATSAGGGGQMLLFGGGGGGGFPGGAPVVAGVEDGRRKRPFLTTLQEELQLDHELYGSFDQQAPERKRRLTAEQVRALERSFEEEKRKLEPERKSELARRLGMAPRQVAVWFQNRRARWRAKQLEQDFDHLKAAHDELLAGRDALLADNDRLRSQVISLTEKLQAKDELPASEPDEQTAASATHTTAALGSVQLEEGHLCTETTNGGAVPAPPRPRLARGANDSPESYFAGARSPPSSSDDDCGGEGCTFFLPDAMLDVVAVEHGRTEEEGEAQLTNWAWLWN